MLKNRTKRFDDIVYVPCGLWNEKTQLRFRGKGTAGSAITEDAAQNTTVVDVDSIDNVCAGDKVTLIKMDVEGSELEALKGAENVIRRDKPRLAICVYHKPEDLYEIPFWIKRTVPEYKLYLRHHSDFIMETVIYATL